MNPAVEGTLGALIVDSGTGPRRVALADYLDGAAEEEAMAAAHRWIKALRHASVDGQPLRRRFQLRGDSLWWFAELYLHKQQVVLDLHRTIAALDRLIARERPLTIQDPGSRGLIGIIGPQTARASRIRWMARGGRTRWWMRLAAMDARARILMLASRASHVRRHAQRSRARGNPPAAIIAFVHMAFWKRTTGGGGAESYIGPVLDALEADAGGVTYVGVGPASNFRARRWWHALTRPGSSIPVTPIESFGRGATMHASRRIWRDRHALRRALWQSAAVRRHAIIQGRDCWEAVRNELAGVALLQWPWSARAMDEAGAALDVLRPSVALTYAEAGGWGRALMLECRRRGIHSAGLQHGFIYRHWLNYRHEADEMLPDPGHLADAGFPRPTLTLLFDEYARQHLQTEGRFPVESLQVTGSPRLDALVRSARAASESDIQRTRAEAGADGTRPLVLFVSKFREARDLLDGLAAAIGGMPDVQLAIKAHPAETTDVYAGVASRVRNIRVLPADAPLALLLRASRAVITVNSTVAIDAAVLGVPAVVIGLPNNLSPFVDAGLMAGVPQGEAPDAALRRILYDEGFRLQIERDSAAYLARFGIRSDGCAAARAADAVRRLVPGSGPPGVPADRTPLSVDEDSN